MDDGIRLHVYYLLKYLSQWHEIHFICFSETPRTEQELNHIRPFCRSLHVVEHEVNRGTCARLRNVAIEPRPFFVEQLKSKKMSQKIRDVVELVQPELVHVDFTSMAPYLKDIPAGTARLFFPHDAVSLLFSRNTENETEFLKKVYMRSQTRKIINYEKKILREFDLTAVVSPVDREILLERDPKADIRVNPNGVDVDYFAPNPSAEKDNILLFRGVMDFFPNDDAACFFASTVMPIVWSSDPDVEFWVAGPRPSENLLNMAEKNPKIQVVGYVDDIRRPMAQASVVVSPMRIGSGIKNKVLESLSMAKAVLATTLSLPAIDAMHDQDLLVADTPDELAAASLRLLKDKNLRKRLGENGLNLVKQKYSWEKHARVFSDFFAAAVAHRRGMR